MQLINNKSYWVSWITLNLEKVLKSARNRTPVKIILIFACR